MEPTIDILETACFPVGCLIPGDLQTALATTFVPQLRAAGLKPAEWTRGAELGEEPYATRVKAIVCQPCNIHTCPLNPHFQAADGLKGLMNGRVDDRNARGCTLIAQLLPEECGEVSVSAHHFPSRKNPRLFFTFTRGEQSQRVICEVGKRTIQTEAGQQPLRSLEHLRQEIRDAIDALA